MSMQLQKTSAVKIGSSPVTPASVGTRCHASSVQVGVHRDACRASLHQNALVTHAKCIRQYMSSGSLSIRYLMVFFRNVLPAAQPTGILHEIMLETRIRIALMNVMRLIAPPEMPCNNIEHLRSERPRRLLQAAGSARSWPSSKFSRIGLSRCRC